MTILNIRSLASLATKNTGFAGYFYRTVAYLFNSVVTLCKIKQGNILRNLKKRGTTVEAVEVAY